MVIKAMWKLQDVCMTPHDYNMMVQPDDGVLCSNICGSDTSLTLLSIPEDNAMSEGQQKVSKSVNEK